MRRVFSCVFLCVLASSQSAFASPRWLWRDDQPAACLVEPRITGEMRTIVNVTINEHLADSFGWSLPSRSGLQKDGLSILVGNQRNNKLIAEMVDAGLKIDLDTLGQEGFRIISHQFRGRDVLVIAANTPSGLKYGCQEVIFFHLNATTRGATVDWPLDITKTPAFAYRGVYMLPCWSAHDLLAHWKRVLKFHSELTINRNWFWLAGFPLLAQYGGPYADTDLANPWNVNGLIQLCRQRGMKFYIGGGWFTWHHADITKGSIERGRKYYLDLLELLPEAAGLYLEPPGEGRGADEETWKRQVAAMADLMTTVQQDRPDFEFAVAVGKFNDPAYLNALHQIDANNFYWWWCWGDPLKDNALDAHPLVLRWHTVVRMSDFHGSNAPPQADEQGLAGVVTSYDPGQGFGNPWNGWAAMGADQPREFDPYNMPFFAHQYRYRENCWNPEITDSEYASRLKKRLFDADMPADAIDRYLALNAMCAEPGNADPAELQSLLDFVTRYETRGTPRNRDTMTRMKTAVKGIYKTRGKQQPDDEQQP